MLTYQINIYSDNLKKLLLCKPHLYDIWLIGYTSESPATQPVTLFIQVYGCYSSALQLLWSTSVVSSTTCTMSTPITLVSSTPDHTGQRKIYKLPLVFRHIYGCSRHIFSTRMNKFDTHLPLVSLIEFINWFWVLGYFHKPIFVSSWSI